MAACSAIRADGGRCRAQATSGSRWCFSHDPDRAEARRRAASKGGRTGGRGRPQADVAEVKARLRDLVDDVLEGRVDRSDAAVVGQLLNGMIRAVSVELQVREQLELVQRVEEIEAFTEQRKKGQPWAR